MGEFDSDFERRPHPINRQPALNHEETMRDLRRILKKYGIENEELVRHLFGFVSFTSMEVVLIEDLAPDVLGKLGGHKVDVVRDLNPEIETSSSSPPLLE